jgi:hypothetical protein
MAINYGSHNVVTTGKVTSNAIDIVDGSNTLYFWNIGGSGDWATTSNWWLDYDHTIPADRIPNDKDIARIRSGVTSVSSGNIVAKIIIVEGVGYLNSSTTIYSDVYFYESTYISSGQIAGNVIFYDTSYLGTGGASGTPVITGNLTLKNSSYITTSIGVHINGTVTFDDSSYLGSASSLNCPNVIINSTSTTNAVNYYSNVIVNSNVGVSNMSIYGDLTLNNSSYSNGSNSIYYGKLILKNSSYIASSTNVTFYGESQLILDNFDNTANVYSASINDNDNALTIIVNSKIPSYGWMFHGISGTNSIDCRTLIFNGVSYYSGTNVLGAAKVVFNDTSYWSSSGSLSGPATPVKIVFNDESYNDGTAGDSNSLVEFNDSSYNSATIGGKAIFNDYSENRSSCTVNGNAVFNDFSKNYGTIGSPSADAVFNDFSTNESGGDVNGSAYYYSASTQNGTDDQSFNPSWA